jgi:hypothetical protein
MLWSVEEVVWLLGLKGTGAMNDDEAINLLLSTEFLPNIFGDDAFWKKLEYMVPADRAAALTARYFEALQPDEWPEMAALRRYQAARVIAIVEHLGPAAARDRLRPKGQ